VTVIDQLRSVLDRVPDDMAPFGQGGSDLALHEGTTRYRISVLAFDEAGKLKLAAQELLLHGFNSAQFCLFGHSHLFVTLESISLSEGGGAREFDVFLKSPAVSLRLASTNMFEMRYGTFAGRLFSRIHDGSFEAPWMRIDVARGVESDAANGCLVLLVTSATANQHALGAKLLLRHGDRDLLTHEFTAGR